MPFRLFVGLPEVSGASNDRSEWVAWGDGDLTAGGSEGEGSRIALSCLLAIFLS